MTDLFCTYILLAVYGGKKDRTYTGAWRFPTTQRKMGSANYNPGSPAYEHWKLIFVIVMFTFWSRNVNKNGILKLVHTKFSQSTEKAIAIGSAALCPMQALTHYEH